MAFRLFSFGKRRETKVGGKRLTSANIKKDIQTFCVWCSRRGGSARGGRGQTRDNGHLSSVPGWPGGRTVGTRSGRSRWQGATRESPLSLCWLDRARLRAQVGGTPRPPGGASGTALTISQPHSRHSVLPSGSGFSWEVCGRLRG